ncbi:MAG: group III truncated hemoglobin [Bacteroidota bacterium]
MEDIENRTDLETLMHAFYGKALKDETIGYFFTEVVPLKMDTHIPLIVDFWETVVFNKAKYQGNAFGVHEHIHQLSAFKDEHFLRWVFLFKQTVDELFAGDKAVLIKQRAESIATVMRIKLVHGGIGTSKINK